MTLPELYVQKRAEAETRIRQHAPAPLQNVFIKLLRPAVALIPKSLVDEQIPLRVSKIGGAPDVPADFVWPTREERPLGFLAQINLEEAALFDMEGLLPKSGLLSFFIDFEDMPGGNLSEEQATWKIFHFHSEELVRTAPAALEDDDTESTFDFKIGTYLIQSDLELVFDITQDDDNWLIDVDSDDLDGDLYYSIWPTLHSLSRPSPTHRLFGRYTDEEKRIKNDCVETSVAGLEFEVDKREPHVSRPIDTDVVSGGSISK